MTPPAFLAKLLVRLTPTAPSIRASRDWKTCLIALAACTAASGCVVEHHDDSGPGLGTVTVNWTISGADDSLVCSDFGADRLDLVIYDYRGAVVDEVEPFCESFSTSVDLLEGDYYADATLVDSFDASVTITEPIDAIDIIAGTDLAIGIDFPADSFL
jgi:hypothetical protein